MKTSHRFVSYGKFTLDDVKSQSATDPATGKPIKYSRIIINYEHPYIKDNMPTQKGKIDKPNFELCEIDFRAGLTIELKGDYKKVKGEGFYNIHDEETKEVISTLKDSGINGFIRSKDCLERNGFIEIGKSDKDIKIFSSPDKSSEIIKLIQADTERKKIKYPCLGIVGDPEDPEWFEVSFDGFSGFWEKIKDMVANTLYLGIQNDDVGLSKLEQSIKNKLKSKTCNQIRDMIRQEMVWSGSQGKKDMDPRTFFNFLYFSPKEGKKETFCSLIFPGDSKERMSLLEACNTGFVARPIVTLYDIYYDNGDKISLRYNITSSMITKLHERITSAGRPLSIQDKDAEDYAEKNDISALREEREALKARIAELEKMGGLLDGIVKPKKESPTTNNQDEDKSQNDLTKSNSYSKKSKILEALESEDED